MPYSVQPFQRTDQNWAAGVSRGFRVENRKQEFPNIRRSCDKYSGVSNVSVVVEENNVVIMNNR
jgi:hypothetical protein